MFAPFDGRCNNLQNPLLGTTNRPFRRLIPACDRDIFNTRDTLLNVRNAVEEDDDERSHEGGGGSHEGSGSNQLRPWQNPAPGSIQCNTSNKLPNVRLVSRTFHTDQDEPSNLDQYFPMFGQFVCHDFILTAPQTGNPNCCALASLTDFVNCLPIIIPAGDSFFNTSQCLTFTRSALFCNKTGTDRHHINQLTAYIDGGNIYGSDSKTSASLRIFLGGRLNVTNPGNLLPFDGSKFVAGEGRAIENPGLTTVHTVFMREHNRIATLLTQRNQSLTDDQLFFQTRRIVIALYQNIVFNEFLKLLIGTNSIFPSSTHQTTYDPSVDPSITNEFSASAHRFGHSLVNGFFNQNDPITGQLLGGYLLRTSNNNFSIYSNNPDLGMTSIIKGMTLQPAQSFDNFVTQELTNFLYASKTNEFAFGSDLAARNIQRGRDNGLSGWVYYRGICTGSAPTSWKRKPSDISQENWNKLRSLYTSVKEIDLFTGSLAEKPVSGGTVGVTSRCILANQFQRLIKGDRYFFTHGGSVGANFTPTQINALRKVRLFDILCLNTNIRSLQKRAFEVARNFGNPAVSCSNAQDIDLSLFA